MGRHEQLGAYHACYEYIPLAPLAPQGLAPLITSAFWFLLGCPH